MTAKMTTTDGRKEFTGRHMLACMLTFFGVIIAVNLWMAWLAGQSWTGLVVKNSYVESQKFNAKLADARAQSQRGWQSELSYADATVRFRLRTNSGHPVALDDLEITLGRPAHEQLDVQAQLVNVAEGSYILRRKLLPGVWAVRIEGGAGDRAFRRDDRLFVPAEPGKSND